MENHVLNLTRHGNITLPFEANLDSILYEMDHVWRLPTEEVA